MLVSDLTEQNISDEIIDKLLFEGLDYKGDKGDIIVVLGSKKAPLYRIPVASMLYHKEKSSKIIVCGGKVRSFDNGKAPEWKAMKNAAVDMGVKTEDILTEEDSISTYENLVNAEKIISRDFPGCKSIILVIAAYHMRRSLKMAEKIFDRINVIPCPANDGSTRRDTWFKTDKGRHTALDECMKFGYYIKNGCIDDFDI